MINKNIFMIFIILLIVGITGFFITKANTTKLTYQNNITPSASPTQNSLGTHSLSDLNSHDTPSSCWSAINGKVYDLTQWIHQHPGGSEQIITICGKDGSAAFNAQHQGQRRPANELTQFYIGDLK